MVSKTNPMEGTVIFTRDQTRGRGQIGRKWHSEPGKNCCFSVILYPRIPVKDQFLINIAIALGIKTALELLVSPNILLKWPNDIIIGGAKLGGILIQNIIKGNNIAVSVVGAGINVNQETFPADIPNPASLIHSTGVTLDIPAVLDVLCSHIDIQYKRLKQGLYLEMRSEYIQSLFGMGEKGHFRRMSDQIVFEGTISGVDNEGHLLIETGKGSEVFRFREIQFLQP